MDIKDKIKRVWHKISDLEDETDAVRDQASDSDRIPYKEISKKLKEVMKKHVDVVGKKILIPPYYNIYFSEYDRKSRAEVEEVLCDELKEELYPEMRKINSEQNKGEINITVKSDSSLERGNFRIDCSMKSKAAMEADKTETRQLPLKTEIAKSKNLDLIETVIEKPPQTGPEDDDMETIIQASVQIKLVVDSGTEKNEHHFEKQKISIGRASQDDLVLASSDFSISRSHVTIELKDGQFILFPTGVNGTLLNDQELELKKEVTVSTSDEIKIMNYKIKLVT